MNTLKKIIHFFTKDGLPVWRDKTIEDELLDLLVEKEMPHCVKCGNTIIAEENSICGYCAGASWEEMHGEK